MELTDSQQKRLSQLSGTVQKALEYLETAKRLQEERGLTYIQARAQTKLSTTKKKLELLEPDYKKQVEKIEAEYEKKLRDAEKEYLDRQAVLEGWIEECEAILSKESPQVIEARVRYEQALKNRTEYLEQCASFVQVQAVPPAKSISSYTERAASISKQLFEAREKREEEERLARRREAEREIRERERKEEEKRLQDLEAYNRRREEQERKDEERHRLLRERELSNPISLAPSSVATPSVAPPPEEEEEQEDDWDIDSEDEREVRRREAERKEQDRRIREERLAQAALPPAVKPPKPKKEPRMVKKFGTITTYQRPPIDE